MFSCCISAFRGYYFRKPHGESSSRRVLNTHLRCLWPFTRRSPRETQGDLSQASSDQATLVSHPWAAPYPAPSRGGKRDLKGGPLARNRWPAGG